MIVKTHVLITALYCAFLVFINYLYNGVLGPLFYLLAVVFFLFFCCPGVLRKQIPKKITPIITLFFAICLLWMLPQYTFLSAVATVRGAYPEYEESSVCFRKEGRNLASSDDGRKIYLIAFENESEAVLFDPYTGEHFRRNIRQEFPFLLSASESEESHGL